MDAVDRDPPLPEPSRPRRTARWWRIGFAVLLAYPLLLIGSTYAITLASGLPGGSNGPCDAYRHALASALVAYTISPRCVEWVTDWMESDEDEAAHRMDAHNNRVGARLAGSSTSLVQLLARVRRAVDRGTVLEDHFAYDRTRIVWLPEEEWANAWW